MGEVTPIRRRARGSGVAIERAPSPETSLRELFQQEAAIEAELKQVRRNIVHKRLCYASKHGLLMLPSVEHLRRLFGI